MSITTVMFLSARNSVRGQMAEAFLRQHGAGRFEVFSSGLNPQPIHPLTVQVMEELGIFLHGRQPTDVRDHLGQNFHFIVTLCHEDDPERPIFPGTSYRLSWPFEDPSRHPGSDPEKLQQFRQVRDQIRRQVMAWLMENPVLSPWSGQISR